MNSFLRYESNCLTFTALSASTVMCIILLLLFQSLIRYNLHSWSANASVNCVVWDKRHQWMKSFRPSIWTLTTDNWVQSCEKANQSVVSYRYEDWHTEWVSCSLFTRHWLFSVMLRTKLNDIVHLKCINCWGRLSNMSPHSLVNCWWMSSDKEFECWKWLLSCCLCLTMI